MTEFAKMTPIELLEETEKAVGDPELSSQHQSLIAKSADLKKNEDGEYSVQSRTDISTLVIRFAGGKLRQT